MREIFDFDLFLLVNTLITTRMWLCFCKELKKKNSVSTQNYKRCSIRKRKAGNACLIRSKNRHNVLTDIKTYHSLSSHKAPNLFASIIKITVILWLQLAIIIESSAVLYSKECSSCLHLLFTMTGVSKLRGQKLFSGGFAHEHCG